MDSNGMNRESEQRNDATLASPDDESGSGNQDNRNGFTDESTSHPPHMPSFSSAAAFESHRRRVSQDETRYFLSPHTDGGLQMPVPPFLVSGCRPAAVGSNSGPPFGYPSTNNVASVLEILEAAIAIVDNVHMNHNLGGDGDGGGGEGGNIGGREHHHRRDHRGSDDGFGGSSSERLQ